MSETEKIILENILDSLDRLFDRQAKAIDVQALLFVSAIALKNSHHYQLAARSAEMLSEILRTNSDEEVEREAALSATDVLRQAIAADL